MLSASQPRTILITGANKGIGFCIIKKLLEQSTVADTLILLGCRDLNRGRNAFAQLGSPLNVRVLLLDTSSRESIVGAIDEIKAKHGGGVDVVINNAAVSTTEVTASAARELFNTNYYGVKMLNELLIPLMRQNGRIVNVSSRVGTIILQRASRALQERFTSPTLTIDQLDQLVEDFITAVETNAITNAGYDPHENFLIYGATKTALNALTQIEARDLAHVKGLLIVCVTPGLCATDMTKDLPNTRSPELGAESILYVVNTPRDQLENGVLYRDGQRLPFIHAHTT